jgi:hypothetical protein
VPVLTAIVQAPAGAILLVSVLNLQVPVGIAEFHQVFSVFGSVMRIGER